MKQSNGYAQDPMTTMETEQQQQEVFQEEQQIGNSTAEDASLSASGEILQECSLAIKPKGPPLFKLRSVFLALFLRLVAWGKRWGKTIGNPLGRGMNSLRDVLKR